ncbi:11779_t:CDS:2 [Ambispora gerdemannii]|uniref:11779_t:CDS:1 n=1 Tax=Ambispora gerdemannii TaxID=144530 RepID=A0A9N9F448_9GLOM|nr:11779_t:CDS:2 [Ambispora gerdemannii]
MEYSSVQKHTSIPDPIGTPSFMETDPYGNQTNRAFSSPIPTTPMTPMGTPKRFYKKPSKPRDFAHSAKKRQSVLALGSITHLQHFYAKRGIIIKPKKPKNAESGLGLTINTNVTDLLKISEEPEDISFPPTPLPPSPPPLPAFITSRLDVETDPEVLLATCHMEIQEMLDAWKFVHNNSGSRNDSDSEDGSSTISGFSSSSVAVDVLDVIATTTKAVQAVKNYSMVKEDLAPESLSKIRAYALEVLEMISELEKGHRDDDTDDSSSEDGHVYKTANLRTLDSQGVILRNYIKIVEECLLFDNKEMYPNTSYLNSISSGSSGINSNNSSSFHTAAPSTASTSSAASIIEDSKRDYALSALMTPPASPGYPNLDWTHPELFEDDNIEAHRPSKSKQSADYIPLPDPRNDKTEFFTALADGKLLCVIFNTVVRRSKRPFGFIDNIHEDTSRAYRATENLKFFAAACKFRFDIKFEEFNASEIAKLSETGKDHLENTIAVFCEKAMDELITTGAYRASPLSRVPSIYLSDSAASSQCQLNSTGGGITPPPYSEAELAQAFANASLSIQNN